MQRRQLKYKLHSKFSRVRAADSRHPGLYTRDGEALENSGVSLAFIESAIHTLATQGNRPALKRALYIYLRLRGVEW